MTRERITDLQKRLLPLFVTQLFEQLHNQFLSLFDLDLLKKGQDTDAFKGTPQDLGTIVAEFLARSEMMGVNIEKAVWSKYPGKCPYCSEERCQCGENKRDPHRRLRIPFPDDGLTVGEVQRMLAEIYPPLSLQEQVLKVAEEIKEAKEEAVSTGVDRDTRDEFADVFARMAAVATHLDIALEEVMP